MTEVGIRYIAGQDGHVKDVIVPIGIFKKMLEELEDKELLAMIEEIEVA